MAPGSPSIRLTKELVPGGVASKTMAVTDAANDTPGADTGAAGDGVMETGSATLLALPTAVAAAEGESPARALQRRQSDLLNEKLREMGVAARKMMGLPPSGKPSRDSLNTAGAQGDGAVSVEVWEFEGAGVSEKAAVE